MKEAKRYNSGKPKLGYFARSFHKALEAIARVKEFGANKYEEDNWKLGNKPDSEYLDSMTRHLDLFQHGETYDQDSGCHHLGHAIWNLCALFELNHGKVDIINEPLFLKQMKYWADKKKDEAPNTLVDDSTIERTDADEWSKCMEKFNEKVMHTGTGEPLNTPDPPPSDQISGYVDAAGNPLTVGEVEANPFKYRRLALGNELNIAGTISGRFSADKPNETTKAKAQTKFDFFSESSHKDGS